MRDLAAELAAWLRYIEPVRRALSVDHDADRLASEALARRPKPPGRKLRP